MNDYPLSIDDIVHQVHRKIPDIPNVNPESITSYVDSMYIGILFSTNDGNLHSYVRGDVTTINVKNVRSIGLSVNNLGLIVLHRDGRAALYSVNVDNNGNLEYIRTIRIGIEAMVCDHSFIVTFYIQANILGRLIWAYNPELRLPALSIIVSIRHNVVVTSDGTVYIRMPDDDSKLKIVNTGLSIIDAISYMRIPSSSGVLLLRNGRMLRLNGKYEYSLIDRVNMLINGRFMAVSMKMIVRLSDRYTNNYSSRIVVIDDGGVHWIYNCYSNSLSLCD